MKHKLKQIINAFFSFFGKTKLGRYAYDQVIKNAMSRKQKIVHQGIELHFSVPNMLNTYRANTFSTKEPETLAWIDQIPKGAVFWDIGANVGLYTCYAAIARNCQVFAFEPSVFNLELLARNIALNHAGERATIVPLPLFSECAVSNLNMTSTEWGGALSTFCQNYGHDGQTLQTVFSFKTVGLSMQEAVDLLKIPKPNFIKMDVDGIEHLILQGGQKLLQQVDGILIEINDAFKEQSESSARYLKEAGFKLRDKKHSEMVSLSSSFNNAYNQIWARSV